MVEVRFLTSYLQTFSPMNLLHVFSTGPPNSTSQTLIPRKAHTMPKPQWHPPWKLTRVISGHTGWVRCVAVDPTNEWFCTGSADRCIKVT